MNSRIKNRVIIYSGPNFLAISFLEYLISKNFLVTIVNKNVIGWLKLVNNISVRNKYNIVKSDSNIHISDFDYSICIYGYDNENNIKIRIYPTIKTLLILPFEKYNNLSNLIPKWQSISVVYLGDVIGPRMDLSLSLTVNRLIKDLINNRVLSVPIGELFYPIFIKDVIVELFPYLFSFGHFGKELLLLGPETSSRSFWDVNNKFFDLIEFRINTKKESRTLPPIVSRKTLNTDLQKTMYETYLWFSASSAPKELESKKNDSYKIKKRFYKPSVFLLLIFAFLSLLPIFLFLIGVGLYYSAYKNFKQSKIVVAKPFLLSAREASRFMASMPLVGKYYRELQYTSQIGVISGDIVRDAYPLISKASVISGKVIQNDLYKVSELVQGSGKDFTKIYNDLNLLLSETSDLSYKNLLLNKYFKDKLDLVEIKSLVREMSVIFNLLPNILGEKTSKTYLILFQNNMELRPAGGFIGSYGLSTFEGGRLIDIAVSDVYSADGQLKGHVEPPYPIREYLNEANWFLRDSNWDPDFPTSAKRAEWFLNKEIGKDVDGVIAIDLNPIKEILKITGPIYLSDYNMEISSENLYEKTQQEVERNFFAGSRKKASFLTSLSRNLISKFSTSDNKLRIKILFALYENLENRHVQMYLHDDTVQNSIAKLNWDGSVKTTNCEGNCYADIFGLVEANLGVNKVNQFIQRDIDFNVSYDNNYLYRKVVVNFKNSANESLGPSGRYKNYIQIIKEKDSFPENIDQLIEVLPESNKKVLFEWKTNLPENFDINRYKLYVRKQAGIDGFGFNLTINGVNHYNSSLSKDLFVNYKNGD